MVTTYCRTNPSCPDINEKPVLDNGCNCCCCQCQISPSINQYTYCILKRMCRKILKEICQEQRKEVYSVFDGGNSMKYENIFRKSSICGKFQVVSQLSSLKDNRLSGESCHRLSKNKLPKCRKSTASLTPCSDRKRASKECKKRQKKGDECDQDKDDQERFCREQAEKDRLSREKAEKDRLCREKAEKERLAREKAEKERLAKEKAERDRLAREKAERERLAREKAERDRLAREKAEQDRLAKEQADRENELKKALALKAQSRCRDSDADKQCRKGSKSDCCTNGKRKQDEDRNPLSFERDVLNKKKRRPCYGTMEPPYCRYDCMNRMRMNACMRAQCQARCLCYPAFCRPCVPCCGPLPPCQPCPNPCTYPCDPCVMPFVYPRIGN